VIRQRCDDFAQEECLSLVSRDVGGVEGRSELEGGGVQLNKSRSNKRRGPIDCSRFTVAVDGAWSRKLLGGRG
jgi:hypothetical protein